MVKNFRKKKFTTYSALEEYFKSIILPQKKYSSKVIGKSLLYWEKQPKEKMTKSYDVINFSNLEKLNKKSISMGRNQNIPLSTMAEMKKDGKVIAAVTFSFPHNEVEQRLMLYAGDKYGTMLLDVSFDDFKKFVYKLTLKEAA